MFDYLSVILIIAAYLMGSLSSAILVCRLMHLKDPRNEGSGNPGATNVLRLGGKKAAIITLMGDVLKGFIPVSVALWLPVPAMVVGATVLAAFLGHLYPVFFRFQGGKGVATAFGGLTALSWPLGLCVLATWFIMAIIFRYSSLAAITAAVLAPVYAWALGGEQWIPAMIIIALLLLWRHRDNIERLANTTESKISFF